MEPVFFIDLMIATEPVFSIEPVFVIQRGQRRGGNVGRRLFACSGADIPQFPADAAATVLLFSAITGQLLAERRQTVQKLFLIIR